MNSHHHIPLLLQLRPLFKNFQCVDFCSLMPSKNLLNPKTSLTLNQRLLSRFLCGFTRFPLVFGLKFQARGAIWIPCSVPEKATAENWWRNPSPRWRWYWICRNSSPARNQGRAGGSKQCWCHNQSVRLIFLILLD